MLRALFLYLSTAKWARWIVTNWGFARRTAKRFVAGDTIQEALEVVVALNARVHFTTLDHLGENVTNAEEALRGTDTYIEILQLLSGGNAASGVSLKLTQLGLGLDFDLCLSNLRCIVTRAEEFGMFVRIDMEDSPTVDRTLQIFQTLRDEGLTNIGMVIQAYLYRSEDDVRNLLQNGSRIRLCKGAYKEPAEVAFPKKDDVDKNFDLLTSLMISHAFQSGSEPVSKDGTQPPITAIATHDEERILFACSYAEEVGLQKSALEFQMLYGIRSDLQQSLVDQGYPVRVYVPYGTEWYPYYMRRLAERPANLWFFISNYFRGSTA